jgi:hypothetical protein
MSHSITGEDGWKHKISLKFKFVRHQLLAFLCDVKKSEEEEEKILAGHITLFIDGALICFVD